MVLYVAPYMLKMFHEVLQRSISKVTSAVTSMGKRVFNFCGQLFLTAMRLGSRSLLRPLCTLLVPFSEQDLFIQLLIFLVLIIPSKVHKY